MAIIAVHGVADQKPGETAEAVLRALQPHSQKGGTTPGFVPHRLVIPVEKMAPPDWDGKGNPPPESLLNEDVGLAFMAEQVRRYDPTRGEYREAYYETTCFRGEHVIDGQRVEIDLYELHWADQSRLSSGLWNLFHEFYQLLFHLGSLGRQSLTEKPGHWVQGDKLFGRVHGVALAMLSEWIPFLNILLFAILSLMIPAKLEQTLSQAGVREGTRETLGLFATLGCAAVLAFISVVAAKAGPTMDGTWRFLGRTVALTGGMLGVSAILRPEFLAIFTDSGGIDVGVKTWLTGLAAQPFDSLRLFVLVWLVCVVAAVVWIIRSLTLRKPRLAIWASLGGAMVGGMLIAEWAQLPSSEASLMTAAMRTAWLVHAGLKWAWIILALAAVTEVLLFLGKLVHARFQSERPEIRAATTALTSIIVPMNLFAIVTFLIYGTLYGVATFFTVLRPPETPFAIWTPYGPHETTAHALLRDMLRGSGSSLTLLILAFWGLAILSCLQAFLWAGWCEATRPLKKVLADLDRQDRLSWQIGVSLSRGYLRLIGPLFWLILALPLAAVIGRTWDTVHHPRHPEAQMKDLALEMTGLVPHSFKYRSIVSRSGMRRAATKQEAATAAAEAEAAETPPVLTLWLSAIGLLLLWVGRLDWVAQRLWPVLDVALDVDNYLRERPWESNPKARIATRYVALLRHLAGYSARTQPDWSPYSRVIVLAHSQGTVISADLLRYLRAVPDERLASLGYGANPAADAETTVCLLTMGSPLRQLYGWRFPYLYAWARHHGTLDGAASPDHPVIAANCRPCPQDLGVLAWINVYGSADYVGRALWRADWSARNREHSWLFTPWRGRIACESRDAPPEETYTRRELCLGPSAHMHYLDDHAEEVARLVEDLMRLPVKLPSAKL